MAIVITAYFARPLSGDLAVRSFSPEDDLPFANFDRHGFGSALAWLSALLFAAPTFWLARHLIGDGDARDQFPVARPVGFLIGETLIVSAFAAPSFWQLSYVIALPFTYAWPVYGVSTLWATTVFVFYWKFRGRTDDTVIVVGSAVLAVIITGPKLAQIYFWAFGS